LIKSIKDIFLNQTRLKRRARHFFYYLLTTLRQRGWAMFSAFFLVQTSWFVIAAPLSIIVSETLISWHGSQGVFNDELLGFLLSPSGYLFAIWFVSMALFNFFLQQGVITLLLAQHEINRRSVTQAIRLLLNRAGLIARLALLQSALLISLFCCLLFFGRWLFGLILADWDINYYLQQQQSQLWIYFAALSVGLLPLALWLGTRWLSWWFALPLCILQKQPLSTQLKDSAKLGKGKLKLILSLNLLWLGIRAIAVLSSVAAILWLISTLVTWWNPAELGVYSLLFPSLVLLLGGLLLSFLDTWLYASIQFYLFRLLRKRKGSHLAVQHRQVLEQKIRLNLPVRLILIAVLLLGIIDIVDEVHSYSQQSVEPNQLSVMGHRAGGWLAQENSIAGLQKAIGMGLAITEIDVQLTGDGQIAVIHDRDLGRLTGKQVVVNSAPFATIQQTFVEAGHPPPQTLPEWLALSDDKITLNIELKRYDQSLALVPAVLKALTKHHSPVIISSLDPALLNAVISQLEAQAAAEAQAITQPIDREVKIALIVAASVGESELQRRADMLIVNQQWVTPWRLLSAHQRKQEVYVWTVNKPADVKRLYYLQVDGIVTDAPVMAKKTIAKLQQENDIEHLINGLRHWFDF
jgi:glycerophosphoryl diester phosphodiesterase